MFEKDEHGKVEWHNPDFNTFGASANAITVKVFGQQETIGDYALDALSKLRLDLEQGANPDNIIDRAGRELGDSVEKVIFINQALNMKEGK